VSYESAGDICQLKEFAAFDIFSSSQYLERFDEMSIINRHVVNVRTSRTTCLTFAALLSLVFVVLCSQHSSTIIRASVRSAIYMEHFVLTNDNFDKKS